MKIGIPKEILDHEYRVAITPDAVSVLIDNGHQVFIETNAGFGSHFFDEDYLKVGATVLPSAESVFSNSQLILKVKQPLLSECKYFMPHHILFTYLHLAADKVLAHTLCATGAAFFAYETVELADGSLPLLTPMSEIAGKLSVQIGAHFLEKSVNGRGILLGGANGVLPGNVLVVGGGTVGLNAALIASGMGANVSILDTNSTKITYLTNFFNNHSNIRVLESNKEVFHKLLIDSDLVVLSVLLSGAKAPKFINNDLLSQMKKKSVIVDVSIDQGGCIEGVEHTSHTSPITSLCDINIYAVPNIPALVPETSTKALVNATLPYILKLANQGLSVLDSDPALKKSVNILSGEIVHPVVAKAV